MIVHLKWLRVRCAINSRINIFVYCKVKKKDHDKFIETLGELKNKMLLMGYSDYESFCEEQINNILYKLNW